MSETLQGKAPAAHDDHESVGGHTHPTDGKYVQIAIILALITAAEVSIPYITDVEGPFLIAMLVMMVAKFAIVVAFFMHLRFDSVLFRRLFVGGIVLAVGVYAAALATFQYWGEDTTSVGDPRAEAADTHAEE